MSARAVGRARQSEVEGNSHRRSNQLNREQLHREYARLLRENEELRRRVAERDGQIAEREGQIAEREGQIAEREGQIAEREKQIADAKSKSRTRKSKSRIWSGNWRGGKRTPPTPPSPLPPTDWPESRDRAAENARAGANRGASPDTLGIIDRWFPPPKRAPLWCCCRSNAGIAGEACRKNLAR